MLAIRRTAKSFAVIGVTALLAPPACAADLDGAAMGASWALPFVGILLSIALGPLLASKFWHAHYGKVAAFWAALTLHAMLGEYVSFIILLFALYTVAGGILVTGDLRGTPAD